MTPEREEQVIQKWADEALAGPWVGVCDHGTHLTVVGPFLDPAEAIEWARDYTALVNSLGALTGSEPVEIRVTHMIPPEEE